MKKFILSIFLLIVVYSCKKMPGAVLQEEVLLEQELAEIDWNRVDIYPSVLYCDTILDVIQKKECFFTFITQNLESRLTQDTLVGHFKYIDTLKVKVVVNYDSKVEFSLYNPIDSLKAQNGLIDSLLRSKEIDFPQILPATKQGIPVNTAFILPIVLEFHKTKLKN